MGDIENLNVVEGRELTPMDDQTGAHNVIVGYDIVDNLLPNRNPIGQELRVDGEVYTVVGVGERKGAVFGQSEDNYVDMPLSTYLHTHGEHESLNISAKAGMAPGALDNLIDEVRALMRARRHDRPGEEDDFAILTNETFIGLFNQITGMFAAVILGIASISLVVGGVVIMNIMLVSVSERTREIGIRKALGARQQDVMLQFLIESAAMALLGGFFGIVVGRWGCQGRYPGRQLPLRCAAVGGIPGAVRGALGRHLFRRLPGAQGGAARSYCGPAVGALNYGNQRFP